MKQNTTTPFLRGAYVAPQTDVQKIAIERGFLTFSNGVSGSSTIDDLDEEDYSGTISWS